MRSTLLCFILALIVATVLAATPGESNARRMARGLPPRAPRRLYRNDPTGIAAAKRSSPSGSPSAPPICPFGPIQCCQRVTTAKDPTAGLIISLLGIVVKDLNTVVGLTCSPYSGTGTCSSSSSPVCCVDNSFNGLIAIGCISVNLGS